MNSTSPQPKISFDGLLGLLLPQPVPQLLVPCCPWTLLSLPCAQRGQQDAWQLMPAHVFALLSASCSISWAFLLPGYPVHSGKWSADCTPGAKHAGPELFICECAETSQIPK